LACPTCGFINEPNEKFCGGCGIPLTSAPRPPTPPAHAPSAYTPGHLAEKILLSRAALEGERKQVTVLFADLKGSTELIRDLDPEAAQQLLDPALRHMMDAVHRFEGTVNQVLGDGIMALFGAPIAHEDHALRACYAALAMQAALQRYADEVRRTHGLALQLRVGLNAGEVVVRTIGNDLHMDYSAVGQTTHLAARMEQLATPGSILLTAATLRLVEGLVQVHALGPIPVKGLAEPVEVFELLGASALRRRLQVATARGLTRFVGRDSELDQLRQVLEHARAGHGQVVALVGEAGVGKSRLVHEYIHAHQTQGWRVLESAAVSYGKATPYFPVLELLRHYGHVEENDEPRIIRAKITGQVLTLDEALQDTIPALLALLEALPEDSPFLTLDPPQRRQRTLVALKRVLLRESQAQPLLLIFEDLHWIDSETQALLDRLVDSLPTARLVLLVNYRPEYQHGWGSKTYYMQLRLDPLPPASADAVLQALLGDGGGVQHVAPLQALKRLLIDRTEGNPFFLEESVRTLVETGVLMGEPGAYRLMQPVDRLQMPATVQAVLAARLDRLPPEEKYLLQTAAVIGTEVPLPLLQAIAELPEAALHSGLAHLQAAEFLYETRLFPEREYTFKHALTHEVAYGSLLLERRRTLHARIVEALEGFAGEGAPLNWRPSADAVAGEGLRPAPTQSRQRVAEQVEQLAYHAVRGEVWDKALPYLRQAGAKAFARAASYEAVACFEQALTVLQQLPASRDTMVQAIDLRFELRNALLLLWDVGRIIDDLHEAKALAEALDDQPRLGRVAVYMTIHCWALGEYGRAVEAGQHALTIAAALGDLGLQVLANTALSQVYQTLGDFRRAIDCASTSLRALAGELVRERFGYGTLPAVVSRAYLAWCLADVGAFAEGIARAEEGVGIAEAVEHPYSGVVASTGVGQLRLAKGDFPQAIPVLERGLRVCQDAHIMNLFPWVVSSLGHAYAMAGRLDEALPLLEQAVEQAASTRTIAYHAMAMVWLGEAYLLAERLEEASQLAQRALELCRARKERAHEAWAVRLLGEIAAHQASPEAEPAEHHYRQALALAAELGMRPLQAHCHLGLGTLYARIGQRQQAHAELTTAIALYRAMDMIFWLPQAEAALVEVSGSEGAKTSF
jgi:predicted ATPase/class 3 adenylate cyclase